MLSILLKEKNQANTVRCVLINYRLLAIRTTNHDHSSRYLLPNLACMSSNKALEISSGRTSLFSRTDKRSQNSLGGENGVVPTFCSISLRSVALMRWMVGRSVPSLIPIIPTASSLSTTSDGLMFNGSNPVPSARLRVRIEC